MRQITKEITKAFLEGRYLKLSNSETDGNNLWLFGNKIARKSQNGIIQISNAGWRSATTKERLNALPNVSISQKKGLWYLNGEYWDGSWRTIE